MLGIRHYGNVLHIGLFASPTVGVACFTGAKWLVKADAINNQLE